MEKIIFVCKKCGKEQKRNEKKSNKNWNIFENKPCQFCGGECTLDIKNIDKHNEK
jgi:hypothetical protein